MRSIYVITMWSGGRPAKKWLSYEAPKALPTGTGVEFVNVDTKLLVRVIGSISVEEFESGREELESGMYEGLEEGTPRETPPEDKPGKRIY
mgnify:CR=1 FL=1